MTLEVQDAVHFHASETEYTFSKIRNRGWAGAPSGVCNLYIEPCVPTTKLV